MDRIIDVFPPSSRIKIRATLSEALKGVIAQNLFKRIDKKGRVAALEILVFTTAIANLVREGKTHQIPGMIQVGKKLGNQPLDDAIMEHLRMKRISPEEAYEKCLDKKKFRPFLPHPPDDDDILIMRRPDLDYVLNTMLESQPEVSDLLFTVDKPLQVESFGELKPVTFDPPIEKLTPFQTEMIALNLIGENQWHIEDLLRRGSCDAAYTLSDKARFRINIFSSAATTPSSAASSTPIIPTLEWLQVPGDHQTDSARKNRPGAGHRRHRLGQIHDPGRHPQRNQPHQARPHHHAGGPGGIRPSAPSWRPSTSASWARTSTPFCQRPARRAAPGAQGHPRRRNARPRNGQASP